MRWKHKNLFVLFLSLASWLVNSILGEWGPFPTTRSFKTKLSLRKHINVFCLRYVGKIQKRNNHQSFWSWVWANLGSEDYYDYRNLTGYEKLNKKLPLSNSSGLKNVFEKLRFPDGLVWTVGLAGEIKLRFRILPFWKTFSKSFLLVKD